MSDQPTPDRPAFDRHLLSGWTPWILAVVAIAVIAGGYAVWSESEKDREAADLSDAFKYDVERYKVIPRDQIGYWQVLEIQTGLPSPHALAVGPAGEIVVSGGEVLLAFRSDGSPLVTMPLYDTPHAMTVDRQGRLYVAFKRIVERGRIVGSLHPVFTVPDESAHITSIAVDGKSIYIADAASRGVLRYSLDGKPLGRIGDKDRARSIPGFNVPSPYFDLLAAPDGLLRIVDPGRHHITAFTTDGDLEVTWGKPSFKLTGFNGCCNPSHIAMLPDGRFVTSEKGIPRVKVHDADGAYVTAVVGPDGLDTDTEPCDVATDGKGRILVLDPGSGTVRIFKPKGRSARGR